MKGIEKLNVLKIEQYEDRSLIGRFDHEMYFDMRIGDIRY
jgi:hypothetical protein